MTQYNLFKYQITYFFSQLSYINNPILNQELFSQETN